jgi:hypothetical protein
VPPAEGIEAAPLLPVAHRIGFYLGTFRTLSAAEHRDRPDEADMIMISTQENVAAMVDQLEKRGYVVDKIAARSLTGAVATATQS